MVIAPDSFRRDVTFVHCRQFVAPGSVGDARYLLSASLLSTGVLSERGFPWPHLPGHVPDHVVQRVVGSLPASVC